MGFSTVDQIVNASSQTASMQRLIFQKFMAQAPTSFVPHTLWKAAGQPIAGTDPTVGLANGRVPTSGSTGAIQYGNAPGGTNHLLTMGTTTATASAIGTLILCDRMAEFNLTPTTTAGAITGVTGTSRMAATTSPGDGGQLWGEVTTAFSASATSNVFAGTNQLGTASSPVTVSITASQPIGRSPNLQLWQNNGVNATTSGFRSVDSLTTTGTITTGNYTLTIVRPLGTIPIPTAGLYVERDFVVEMPNLPFLYSNACLFFIWLPANNAVQATIFGELRMCYN